MNQLWSNDAKTFWNPDMDILRDLTILVQLCGGWVVLFAACNKWVMNPLARYLIKDAPQQIAQSPRKSPILSDTVRQRKRPKVEESVAANGKPEVVSESIAKLRHKFVTSLWKFASYAGFVLYGCYAVSFESKWFWSPKVYHIVFPKGATPDLIYWYYQLETSYYIFSIGLMAWEPKMKDKAQMTVHHLVTLTLLLTSYVGRMIKFGVPIMLLHDAADPLMEVAKMFLYCGYEAAANVFLAMFTVAFMYLRNWVFPRHIIWTLYSNKDAALYPYFRVTLFSLCTLAALHIYWAGLILKIGYSNFVTGQTTGDIREDND